MDFAKGGELFAKVSKWRFSEDLSHRYFQQLISAFAYCHSRRVFHRDLKSENLLLDKNWNLKVSDFSLSAIKDQIRSDGLLHTLCGMPAYVAPEILAKKGYDGPKTDVWSCGVILYVRLLDTNPEMRITVNEIINDPWFKKGYEEIKFRSEDLNFKNDDYDVDKCLNAFDPISFSSEFDLSILFQTSESCGGGERFASAESPGTIVGTMEAAEMTEGMEVVERSGWRRSNCIFCVFNSYYF